MFHRLKNNLYTDSSVFHADARFCNALLEIVSPVNRIYNYRHDANRPSLNNTDGRFHHDKLMVIYLVL